MVFNSVEFLIFFVVVTTLYFILPKRGKLGLLFISSCVFYMAFIPEYILILFATILVDYVLGIIIYKTKNNNKKKLLLVGSVIFNLGFLFFFKYFNFFNSNINYAAAFLGIKARLPLINMILPIGLSFHTFQSLSYIFEVYRGNQKAENNLFIYSLYVMFYPQLVSGPIERPYNLLKQLRAEHKFEYNRVINGLQLMLWGLFKKVVIADNLALFVSTVYDNSSQYKGPVLILATYMFAIEILCDFSGYTDIARGAARVMGYELMKNFNFPYLAESVSDFWRRWHISLTSWFTDYIYIPLGGSRKGKLRTYRNVMVVFLFSGLWHGASWNYVLWGGINGLFIIIERILSTPRKAVREFFNKNIFTGFIYKVFSIIITFNLICITWVFFRAKDLNTAMYILNNILSSANAIVPVSVFTINLCTILLAAYILIMILEKIFSLSNKISASPAIVRWGIYYAAICITIIFSVSQKTAFIYFQF